MSNYQSLSLTALPLRDRPARRVSEAPTACNTVELLAALIGGARQVDAANALLAHFGSLRAIRQASAGEIASSVHGIGQQTAARLVSALEIGRRLASEVEDERPAINSPEDAARLIQYEMGSLDQEEMWVLLLDTRNRLVEIDKVYRGTVNCSHVRTSEVFKAAVKRNAPSIVVAHAHPSGNPEPSSDDVAVTRALVAAGNLLDIHLTDHLVIGRNNWVSLRQRNLGF